MGESTCLMRNYSSLLPETVSEDKEGNSILGGSVSFGRFMSETLAWEKWSSFSHNRYLEEVEKYSTPGTVAQKKAYFEAHYKKIAAKKAAALLAENNSESNHVTDSEDEESVEESKSESQNQLVESNIHVTVNKPCEVENRGPAVVAPAAHNGFGLDEKEDGMEIQKMEDSDLLVGDHNLTVSRVEESEIQTDDMNPTEIQVAFEPFEQLGDGDNHNNITDMEHGRDCSTEMSMEILKANHEKSMLKDKRSNSSVAESLIPTRASKILPSPFKPSSPAHPKQETSATPSSRKPIQESAATPSSRKPIQESAATPKSRKPKQESSATPNSLKPKQESGVTANSWKPKQEISATPKSRSKQENGATSSSLKPKQESGISPSSRKPKQESTAPLSSWKLKQESSATPSSRKPITDSIENKRSASKSLHMSINISHCHVHRISESVSNKRASPILRNSLGSKTAANSSKTISDTLSFAQRNAATSISLTGAQRLASMTPDNKRIKTPLGHTTPKNRISDKKWQSFSVDHSKSSSTSGRNAFSPTVSVGFNFRSEERAAKRKEFFQKLEEKFNAKEAQEEKAEGELKSLSQSLGFKAKPMPDFFHEKRVPRNQIKKLPVTRPKSPKLGRKQNLTVVHDASSSRPPSRPPVKTSASKNWMQNQNSPNSPNKKTHENTSPNIQSQ
ncbi:protein WVD2-like 7 isoform X2 [Aristolochia californica]|uniref:protein WVD2-like 7 isoform X2 n=1 Tax=Aristolochia californica TaxID=171875 RepID=UPI0035DDEECC